MVWHGRPGLSRPRLQLVGSKTKYRSVECKEKHKFVCSIVVKIVYLRQEMHGSKLDLLKKFVLSVFSYITLFFRSILIIDRDDLYFFTHVTCKFT
jgi:hypothetical protein